jgi:hypothetical protein
MRDGPRLLSMMLVAFAAAVAGGCGGGGGSSGNGVASKTPTEIVASTKAAAEGASSVHVSGAVVNGGTPITLDMHLLRGGGATGQISEGGLSFELIETEGTVYVKGSPAFYSHFAGSAAALLLEGKWLKAPASDSSFASLAPLTELRGLLDSALANHGTLVKGPTTTTTEGQQVVGVTDTSQATTLYVATTGRPYPVAIVKSGAGGGRVVFDKWDEPVSLTAPANAIDITKLEGGH